MTSKLNELRHLSNQFLTEQETLHNLADYGAYRDAREALQALAQRHFPQALEMAKEFSPKTQRKIQRITAQEGPSPTEDSVLLRDAFERFEATYAALTAREEHQAYRRTKESLKEKVNDVGSLTKKELKNFSAKLQKKFTLWWREKDLESSYAPSSYIVQKVKDRFGPAERFEERQRSFVERTRQEVTGASLQVGEAVREGKNLQELFHDILHYFAEIRHQIAVEQQSGDAKLFGTLHRDEYGERAFPYTVLAMSYEEYNGKALSRLREKMSEMRYTIREFQQTTHKIEETVLGRKFIYQFEILSGEEIAKRKWFQEPDQEIRNTLMKLGQEHHWDREPPTSSLTPREISDRCYSRSAQLKASYPDLYKWDKMHFYLVGLASAFPSPKRTDLPGGGHSFIGETNHLKSDYLLGTARIEIEGKHYALAQLLTWLYRNYTEDPLDRMVRCSTAISISQDPFLNEASLRECARLFEEALQWDRSRDVSELKEKVALLHFLLAQAAPFCRGSSSIAEWLTMTIYKFHQFEHCYKNDGAVDLEALTAVSFSDYLKEYNRLVELF